MPARAGAEDLFPRGHARGQPAKRFAQNEGLPEKPVKRERQPEHAASGRLTPGATVLAVVTRADARAVHLELPSGGRARADPHEALAAAGAHRLVDPVAAAAGGTGNEFDALNDAGCSPLYAVLRPGQVVRAAVVARPANAGTNHTHVSLHPALVNAGLAPAQLLAKGTPVFAAVRSVEDHGYVLDFGAVPTKGFLPFEDAPDVARVAGTGSAPGAQADESADESASSSEEDSEVGDENTLLPGTPLEVVVSQTISLPSEDADADEDGKHKKSKKKKKSARGALSTVRVSAKKDLVRKAETLLVADVNFHGLRAGMRVSGKVLSVNASKVVLTVFGLFSVSVNILHVPHGWDGLPSVKAGASVTARLLTVDPARKTVSASLLPEVVKDFNVRAVPEEWTVGTIVKDLVVDRVDPTFGVFLRHVNRPEDSDGDEAMGTDENRELKTAELSVPLFAHISRVSERRPDRLEKMFYKGQVLERAARIVSTSSFDGVVNVDLRPSILSRAALDITEVKPGALYDCKIVSHLSSGALSVAVDGDFHIHGIIPKRHIADTTISSKALAKHPNLRVGGVVKCVALSVNMKRRTIYLSSRKSFASSTDPVLCSYDEADKALKRYHSSLEEAGNRTSIDESSDAVRPPVFVGTVEKVLDKFLVVSFCNWTSGTVDFGKLDLTERSEAPGKKRKRKSSASADASKRRTKEDVEALYPVGETVRVCVVRVDPRKNKLFLSMDLTGSDISPVTKKQKTVKDPEVSLGTVIDAVIKSVDEVRKRFTACIKLDSEASKCNANTSATETKQPDAANGASSLKKESRTLSKEINCFLPFGHLCDSVSLASKMSEEFVRVLKSGMEDSLSQPLKVSNLLVLRYESGTPVLSRKQSLISASREKRLPSSFSELEALCFKNSKAGDETPKTEVTGNAKTAILQTVVLNGYVKAVLPNGVLIGLLGDLTGFAKKSRIADFFVGDLQRSVPLHSSIAFSMQSFDKDAGRFSVSLRPSDAGTKSLPLYAQALVDDLHYASSLFRKDFPEKEFAVGSIVSGHIEASRPYGIVMKLKSALGTQAVGVALNGESRGNSITSKAQLLRASLKDGQASSVASAADDASVLSALAETAADNAIQAATPAAKTRSARKKVIREKEAVPMTNVRVLDVDPFTGVVDVSQEARWISSLSKRPSLSGKDKLKGTVLLVKDDYVIVAVQKSKTKTVIAHALLPTIAGDTNLNPGIEVKCQAVAVDKGSSTRIYVSVDWNDCFKTVASSSKEPSSTGKRVKKAKVSDSSVDKEIVAGAVVHGPVTKVLPYQAHVKLGRLSSGRIHITNTDRLTASEAKSMSLGPLSADVEKRFSLPKMKGVVKDVMVVDISDGKKRKNADNENGEKMVVAELAGLGARDLAFKYDTVPAKGDRIVGFLKTKGDRKRPHVFALTPKLTGACDDIDAISDSDTLTSVLDGCANWKPCLLVVQSVSKRKEGGREVCSVRLSASSNGSAPDTFFNVRIEKVTPGYGLRVALPWNARPSDHKNIATGFVRLCDVSNDFAETVQSMASFKTAQIVRVRVASVETCMDSKKTSVFLTMRPSDKNVTARDALITKKTDPTIKKGAQMRAFVYKVNKFGAFVWIGREVSARIQLSDLSDDFVKEPQKSFPVGMMVEGKISEVTQEVKQDGNTEVSIGFSLRKHERKPKQLAPSKISEGEIVNGTVSRVERFGAIVKLEKGNSALLHTSEVDQDRQVKDAWHEWTVGQRITAVVIDATDKKRRVGTKRCHFEAAGVPTEKIDSILEDNAQKDSEVPILKKQKVMHAVVDSDDDDTVFRAMKAVEEEAVDVILEDEGRSEDSEESSDSESESEKNEHPVLNIPHSFSMEEEGPTAVLTAMEVDEDENAEHAISEGADGATKDHVPRKPKTSREKREKKRAKEAAEREIQEKEETLAANPDSPETAEDFERMLLGEPNSSALWIRYMAFRLSLSQIDKARAVAERALEAIDLTKEIERVNIWMSYVNLEANFGGSVGEAGGTSVTKAAAVFRVFDRAAKRITDDQDFYLQVFQSLRESEPDIAEEVIKRAIHKFKSSKEVYIAAGNARFENGDLDGGRKVLERALVNLEKRDHVSTIMKFSQLEYRHGSVERGRTVFESLIGNYPKRLDLWSVFLDMESGVCNKTQEQSVERDEAVKCTRLIFERCASLELSSKKMKSVFKKWLTFEKRFGDKTSHKAVLAKAKQYVENKTLGSDLP